MAIREVRIMGDDILEKQCKPVTKMTMRTKILIEDMLDTMYEKYGVGLAAPQVGVLKQIVVIDVGEGPIVLINPEIIETSGEQTGEEGCLSLPGKWGIVTRPNYVKVRALNEEMEEVELEGEGLLASKKNIYFWAKAILAGMSTNIKINVIWNWISHLEEKSIDSVIFTKCVIRF